MPKGIPKNGINRGWFKDKCLVSHGFKVYRFWEHEINHNVKDCVDIISKELYP